MLMYMFIVYIFGIISFILSRNYLLLMLLSLEFVVISLYFNMMYYFSFLNYELFFSMIFLTMSVCEGALGLGILIMMVRVHGNNHILSFSSLW
uniref:NADH-ubiquinone oxidoreductase chain 4L n=1 Tax=Agasicles hygrophila TaxID=715812 RepID=A0A0U2N919_9CUCU|nr:NADH dehydrogenase subunit 4L [Agasicles hygrophila]ALJ78620.1 NADH dehydrogenase subunit 4L [Agasicles hygrophila]